MLQKIFKVIILVVMYSGYLSHRTQHVLSV